MIEKKTKKEEVYACVNKDCNFKEDLAPEGSEQEEVSTT